jgi:hypothetical protein
LPVVRAVAATTRLAALVAGSLLVRVEATVAQPVVVETIALALALRKRMATLLVLVEVEQQLIRVAVAVVIGAVGVRLNRRN